MMRLFLFVEIVSGARIMQEDVESLEADAESEKAASALPVVFDQAHPALTVTPGALTGTGNFGWSTTANSAREVHEGEGICGISFKCNTPESDVFIGFTSEKTVTSWRDVDFGFTCRAANFFNDVFQHGRKRHQMVGRTHNGNPTSDVHAIRVNADGKVEHSLNGNVYYTHNWPPVSYPWHVAVDANANPSLSDVEYLFGGCGEPNQYVLGQAGGGNTCPGGDVSEAECLAAAQSLLPAGQRQGRTQLVSGSWGWVPPGCSMQSHRTQGVQGDWAAHYNRRSSGRNDGGYTKVCLGDPWTLVLQYGATAYQPNAGAVGTLDENQKQHAKLSDAAINALPSGGDAGYDYYKLSSESATANARDTIILRAQGAYNDMNPTLGFSSWEVCREETLDACTTWEVASGGSLGIDTFYPCGQSCNDCSRWFTGYGNRILCYPDPRSGGRCWASGARCSIGYHGIREDVKMYKLTA